MKKNLVILLSVVGISLLFSACSSVPLNANLTGNWRYTYGENDDKGSMRLHQNGIDITGVSNNIDGQYDLTGKLVGNKLSLEGSSDKNQFTANIELSTTNNFAGSYNSTTGTSGDMEGHRVK